MLVLKMYAQEVISVEKQSTTKVSVSFPEKTPIKMDWDYGSTNTIVKSFNYKIKIFIDAKDYIQDLVNSSWYIPDLPELILEIKEADSNSIILVGNHSKYIPCSHISSFDFLT